MKKAVNYFSSLVLKLRLFFLKSNQELVLVTGSSSSHFKSLYQLLKSIKKYEIHSQVIVFDLGLKASEQEIILNDFTGVQLRKFNYKDYPDYFNININNGEYAWKPVIFEAVFNEFKCSVCWIDAGNVLTKRLDEVRKIIELYGFYSPYSKGTISDWTHPSTLSFLKVDKNTHLLKQTNLNGACISANYNNKKVAGLISKWQECALVKDCIAPVGSSRNNHRYDQAILSILIYKYLPEIGKKMTFKKFGFKIHQDVD